MMVCLSTSPVCMCAQKSDVGNNGMKAECKDYIFIFLVIRLSQQSSSPEKYLVVVTVRVRYILFTSIASYSPLPPGKQVKSVIQQNNWLTGLIYFNIDPVYCHVLLWQVAHASHQDNAVFTTSRLSGTFLFRFILSFRETLNLHDR